MGNDNVSVRAHARPPVLKEKLQIVDQRWSVALRELSS
jgi:hypothetical protein